MARRRSRRKLIRRTKSKPRKSMRKKKSRHRRVSRQKSKDISLYRKYKQG